MQQPQSVLKSNNTMKIYIVAKHEDQQLGVSVFATLEEAQRLYIKNVCEIYEFDHCGDLVAEEEAGNIAKAYELARDLFEERENSDVDSMVLYEEEVADQVEGLEIHKMIVLSTAHITAEVNTWLGDSKDTAQRMSDMTEDWTRVFVSPADPGYFLTLSRMEDEEDDTPQCVKDICAYASKHGCNVIRLDSDGPKMKDLPTYSW